jgi:hypothetical protein
MTITLPDYLSERLTQEAQARQVPVEEFVTDLLTDALESVEQVVAHIKALSSSSSSLYPGYSEPTQTLQSTSEEAPIDLEEWNRQWAFVETIMREEERLDAIRDLYQAAN